MQCCRFTCVQLSVTLWTVACQAPLSMGFSRHEYWSGFPCLPPEDLPHSGTELCLFYISCTRMLGAIVRNPAHGKGHEEETRQAKASQILREPPWTYSSIYPKTRICLPYYIMPFTNSSDINRGLSPHHLFL